jgi:hypothetical protein
MLRGPCTGRWCWRPTAAWCPWVSETALYYLGANVVFLVNTWKLCRCTAPSHEEFSYSPSLMKSTQLPLIAQFQSWGLSCFREPDL